MPSQRVIDLKQLKKILKEESGKFPRSARPVKARANDIAKISGSPGKISDKKTARRSESARKSVNESTARKKTALETRPAAYADFGRKKYISAPEEKKQAPRLPQKEEAGGLVRRGLSRNADARTYSERDSADDAEKKTALSRFTSILRWQAPEYEKSKNPREQVIMGGIISVGFFAGALYIENYLLSLIVFLTYAIFCIYTYRDPKLVEFVITEKGVKANDRIYYFEELKSFCIFFEPPFQRTLSLESRRVLMPYIRMPIENVDPIELKNALMMHLPEKYHKESLIDMISTRLGF